MKANEKRNKEAMCPFYSCESGSAISCAGVPQCLSIKINFQTAAERTNYCKTYCCGRFQDCAFFDGYKPSYGVGTEFDRFDPLYGGILVLGDKTTHIYKHKQKEGGGDSAREDTKVLLADSENERERTGDGQEAHGAADL